MMKLIAKAESDQSHKDDVESLVFVKGHLFSGGYDGTVKKWTPDLKLVKEWRAHEYPVYSMATDGENHIFTSSAGGEIKEWNVEDGSFNQMVVMVSPLTEKSTDVKSIVFKQGMLFAGDMFGVLHRYQRNLVKDREKLTFTEIWSLAVSPEGERVFTARDNNILVSDIAVDIVSEAAAEESRKILNQARPMPFFSATNFQREDFEAGGGGAVDVVGSIEGRAPVVVGEHHVCCVDKTGMHVRVFKNDKAKYPLVALLKGHDMIINAVVIVDDKRIASSGWDGKLKLWDIDSSTEIGEVDLGGYIDALLLSTDEKDVLYASGKSGLVAKINLN